VRLHARYMWMHLRVCVHLVYMSWLLGVCGVCWSVVAFVKSDRSFIVCIGKRCLLQRGQGGTAALLQKTC
jgi:hypothetical protein